MIEGQISEMRFTIVVTRAETGEEETFELVGEIQADPNEPTEKE